MDRPHRNPRLDLATMWRQLLEAIRKGPTWRQIYLAMFCALFAASMVLFIQLKHGVDMGSRIIAIADSAHTSSELARRTIARQDTTQMLILKAQSTVIAKLDSLSDRNRRYQDAKMRALAGSVRVVQAQVTSLDSTVKSVPPKKR